MNLKKKILVIFTILTLFIPQITVFADDNNRVADGDGYTVEFVQQDGKVIKPVDDTFITDNLTEGQFVLRDKTGEKVEKPSWECSVQMKRGIYNYTNTWLYSDGTINTHDVRVVEAKVYDKNSRFGGKLLKTFKIDNRPISVEDFKLYSNGVEFNNETPAKIEGSKTGSLSVKVKLKGSDDYVPISNRNLDVRFKDEEGSVILNTNFYLDDSEKEGILLVSTRDGANRTQGKVVREEVALENFTIDAPKVFYIDQYNGLGEKWVGLPDTRYNSDRDSLDIKYYPENTSHNQRGITWTSDKPEIAHYEELHGNGFVPDKAGTVTFTGVSKVKPELQRQFTIEYKYKKPLKEISLENNEITLNVGDIVNLPVVLNPVDATDGRAEYTYSKDGIVKVQSGISRRSTHEPHKVLHTISALKPGTVTVTGTPIDQTAGAKAFTFKVNVVGQREPLPTKEAQLNMVDQWLNTALPALKEDLKYTYGEEWQIQTLARGNVSLSQRNIDKYLDSLEDKADEIKQKKTDVERVMLTLSALGKEEFAKELGLVSEALNINENASSNQLIFSVLALNSGNYSLTPEEKDQVYNLAERILQYQKADGSVSLSKTGDSGDVDITAMAVQALAPYERESKIGDGIKKALEYLKTQYDNGKINNSCSIDQIILALGEMGSSITENKDFTDGSNNLITDLGQYYNGSEFKWKKDGDPTFHSRYQGVQALLAVKRSETDATSYFKMTDGYNPAEDPEDEDGDEEEYDSRELLAKSMALQSQSGTLLTNLSLPEDFEKLDKFKADYEYIVENDKDGSVVEDLDSVADMVKIIDGLKKVYNSAKDRVADPAALNTALVEGAKVLGEQWTDETLDTENINTILNAKISSLELKKETSEEEEEPEDITGKLLQKTIALQAQSGTLLTNLNLPEDFAKLDKFKAEYEYIVENDKEEYVVEELGSVADMVKIIDGLKKVYNENKDKVADQTALNTALVEGAKVLGEQWANETLDVNTIETVLNNSIKTEEKEDETTDNTTVENPTTTEEPTTEDGDEPEEDNMAELLQKSIALQAQSGTLLTNLNLPEDFAKLDKFKADYEYIVENDKEEYVVEELGSVADMVKIIDGIKKVYNENKDKVSDQTALNTALVEGAKALAEQWTNDTLDVNTIETVLNNSIKTEAKEDETTGNTTVENPTTTEEPTTEEGDEPEEDNMAELLQKSIALQAQSGTLLTNLTLPEDFAKLDKFKADYEYIVESDKEEYAVEELGSVADMVKIIDGLKKVYNENKDKVADQTALNTALVEGAKVLAEQWANESLDVNTIETVLNNSIAKEDETTDNTTVENPTTTEDPTTEEGSKPEETTTPSKNENKETTGAVENGDKDSTVGNTQDGKKVVVTKEEKVADEKVNGISKSADKEEVKRILKGDHQIYEVTVKGGVVDENEAYRVGLPYDTKKEVAKVVHIKKNGEVEHFGKDKFTLEGDKLYVTLTGLSPVIIEYKATSTESEKVEGTTADSKEESKDKQTNNKNNDKTNNCKPIINNTVVKDKTDEIEKATDKPQMNEGGKVVGEQKKEVTDTKVSKNEKKAVTKIITGDNTMLIPLVVLAVICLVALIFMIRRKK